MFKRRGPMYRLKNQQSISVKNMLPVSMGMFRKTERVTIVCVVHCAHIILSVQLNKNYRHNAIFWPPGKKKFLSKFGPRNYEYSLRL